MTFRVIVADDEDCIREGMASQIESMGSELRVVACASDGVEALELVEGHIPEIVVIDINMPRMDGLECIRRIREKDPSCIIIIVSGYDRFEYAQKALQFSVDYYLLKPVEDEEFEATIRRGMQKYSARLARLAAGDAIGGRENSPEKILAYIKAHYTDDSISVEKLESVFSMSRSALFKSVKSAAGVSVIEYITSLRMDSARALLLDRPDCSVKEVCSAVGYRDQHYFSRLFKQCFGCSPKTFREGCQQKDTNGKQ